MNKNQQSYNPLVHFLFKPVVDRLVPILQSSPIQSGVYPFVALCLAVLAALTFSISDYVGLLVGAILTYCLAVWQLSCEEVRLLKDFGMLKQNWVENIIYLYCETLLYLGLTLYSVDQGSKNLVFIGGLSIIGCLIFHYTANRYSILKGEVPTGSETLAFSPLRWLIICVGAALSFPGLVLFIMAVYYNVMALRKLAFWNKS